MTFDTPIDNPEVRQLKRRIARSRAELSRTVEALVEKTEAKKRSVRSAHRARWRAMDRWHRMDSRALGTGAMAIIAAVMLDAVLRYLRRRLPNPR
jgi:hypothetical protein